jgi:hypothetical protein
MHIFKNIYVLVNLLLLLLTGIRAGSRGIQEHPTYRNVGQMEYLFLGSQKADRWWS